MDFEGSFAELAATLGADVVGEPVDALFYNDIRDEKGLILRPGNVAMQYSTKGKFEAVKVSAGSWAPPYFFLAAS